MERVKGLGGKKVGGESCRTCPQGGLGSINSGSHCSLAGSGDKVVFQEKAAVPRALEAKGYLELIMGKTG